MSTLSVVLLVVIALASLAQAACLLRLALEGRKTARGLEGLAGRLIEDMTPSVAELSRATANVAEVSDIASAQVRRLDTVVGEATDALLRTGERLHHAIVPNLARVAIGASVFRVGRRVFRLYRRLRG